jgi:hypothetical protein
MFCSREKRFISGIEIKTKMPRRKYVFTPFSRGILFYIVKRIKAKSLFYFREFLRGSAKNIC